ncbi:uncharacterized protein MYCFIDRAFT_81064 [Pseudocercospora fijiensis CIRAD86]|uniref:Carboxymuconolactone decarboxylase-like domain-containing protein n=1 Tax=Pseudocercospora fijiensis (strain CIRAD86) TaxID=383855 RepID=M2ZKG0_PSEFD|nr:uncharacterized protein MYCFIDRAFT_81064 [Pseudocercospora fijiensis CIRAD86]EME79574.1 hypothetical protein MYCFIDRAFT_81064 [Pseudocercospora fijiensis CIRAD86]
MNRIGLMHPSTLTGKHNAETSALYQAFSDHVDRRLNAANNTFRLPSTGAMVGQFAIFLHNPKIGRSFLELSDALRELPGLNPRTREIIALVVATNERSAYQTYSHGRLAMQRGLTQNELDSLYAGLYSHSFAEADKAAYTVARELCVSSGPLSDRVWNDAVTVLGREGAIAVVHHTAFHRYVATLLRGFDSQVPAPGERVESENTKTE